MAQLGIQVDELVRMSGSAASVAADIGRSIAIIGNDLASTNWTHTPSGAKANAWDEHRRNLSDAASYLVELSEVLAKDAAMQQAVSQRD